MWVCQYSLSYRSISVSSDILNIACKRESRNFIMSKFCPENLMVDLNFIVIKKLRTESSKLDEISHFIANDKCYSKVQILSLANKSDLALAS